jgi:hypothetical protein
VTTFEIFALFCYWFRFEPRSVARRRWEAMPSEEKSAWARCMLKGSVLNKAMKYAKEEQP